jgi:ribose transport system substrate-binding protein
MAAIAALVGSPLASSRPQAAPAWLTKMQAQVNSAYAGQQMAVPTTGPKAMKGKNVWEIACLLAIPDCAQANGGISAGAKALGWKLTVVDGKNDPALTGQFIQRAIAAKADGMIVVGIDCPAIKNALSAAKAAKIPVVTIGGLDCKPPLFTASSLVGGLPFLQGETKIYDVNRFDWGAVQTGGKMNLIDVNITNLAAVSLQDIAMRKELKKCPTCKIVATVNLSVTNLPQIAQLLPAALQQHPEANAIWLFNGSALTLGAQNAIERAGRQKSLVVISGTCTNGEPNLMRQGWKIGCDALTLDWNGWNADDILNRILAGQAVSQIPKVGIGLQMIDATHNLPKGNAWVPPIDYAAAYRKLWGV